MEWGRGGEGAELGRGGEEQPLSWRRGGVLLPRGGRGGPFHQRQALLPLPQSLQLFWKSGHAQGGQGKSPLAFVLLGVERKMTSSITATIGAFPCRPEGERNSTWTGEGTTLGYEAGE